jgi:hypothetical protein
MRQLLLVLLAWLPLLAHAAAPPPEGRWEGRVEIPGNELPLIVDLARTSTGSWAGSIVIPGLGIKGAALANLVVTDVEVSFDLGNVLGTPSGAAQFKAQAVTTDRMTGEMRQAGNVAKFALAKRGPAQVDAPPRSTAVARELEADWVGEFELGGYPRKVTITLENHAGGAASAKLVIVGKRVNDLPVDLVVQQGPVLRIESQTTQIVFEGRLREGADEIRGAIELSSVELPLTLRRAKRAS